MLKNIKSGFTLIELSIVLVIIGLIVGGILVGQDLISAANRRAIISEIEHYKTAVMTFRSKYNAIPGDMANATTFWGDSGNGWGFPGSAGNPATANGNGNGLIDGTVSGGFSCDGTGILSYLCDDEPVLFWKHLSNAGLISGGYTGTLLDVTSTTRVEIINQNIPQSSVNSTFGYVPVYICFHANNVLFFNNGFCGNIIAFGTVMPAPQQHNYEDLTAYPALTPFDALSIDTKIDDGKPASGSVMASPKGGYFGNNFNSNCTTSSVPATSTYNTAVSTIECGLFFAGGF